MQKQNIETQEKIVTDEMVQEFIKVVLKLEQENLYLGQYGMKDKIISEVKKRVRK